MTWTACPHCRKATFAYGDSCEYCNKPLGGQIRFLYGVGGIPLERFICRECFYVNDPEDSICQECGRSLPGKNHDDPSNPP